MLSFAPILFFFFFSILEWFCKVNALEILIVPWSNREFLGGLDTSSYVSFEV